MKTFENISDVLLNDGTVNRIKRAGGGLTECVLALANEKQALIAQLIELEQIAPKKFRLPNGNTVIWQCPVSLIPETEKPADPARRGD